MSTQQVFCRLCELTTNCRGFLCLPIAQFYLPVKNLLRLLLEMVDQAKHEHVLQILYP